jgi:hypothetical protein
MSEPGHTHQKLTAKLKDSSKLRCVNGHTRNHIKAQIAAPANCQPGFTETTGIDLMAA